MSGTTPTTVVETPEFLSATRKLLTEEERAILVDYLAPDGGWRGAESAAARA